MQQIGKGDFEAGFKLIKPRIIVSAAEFEAMVGQASLQLPAMKQRFGSSLGYEFLEETKRGENLIRSLYLYSTLRQARDALGLLQLSGEGWLGDQQFSLRRPVAGLLSMSRAL